MCTCTSIIMQLLLPNLDKKALYYFQACIYTCNLLWGTQLSLTFLGSGIQQQDTCTCAMWITIGYFYLHTITIKTYIHVICYKTPWIQRMPITWSSTNLLKLYIPDQHSSLTGQNSQPSFCGRTHGTCKYLHDVYMCVYTIHLNRVMCIHNTRCINTQKFNVVK